MRVVRHTDQVLPAWVNNVAREEGLSAAVFEAPGVLVLRVLVGVVPNETNLLKGVDLQRVVAIGAGDEEAVVVAGRRAASLLEAGAGVGIGQDVLDDAADLVRALFGEPLFALITFEGCDFGLKLRNLGGGVIVPLDGCVAHAREREGRAREEPNKLGQTHMRSLLVSGRGSDISPTNPVTNSQILTPTNAVGRRETQPLSAK